MTPEASRFLAKAAKLLAEADKMLGIDLADAAGRTAYLAGFHAAQALIFERLGKMLKTHNGVQTEFLRLTRDDAGLDCDVRAFLSRSYNLKSIADYETGPDAGVSLLRAAQAVVDGRVFVACIEQLVETSEAKP